MSWAISLFLLLDGNDKLHFTSGSLFQAKLRPKLDSLSQKYLYDLDKDFEVPSYLGKRPGSPGKLRNMPTYEEGRARALRYLILNSNRYIQARHTPWSNDFQCRWSSFLDGLISGRDGLRTEPSSKSPTAWDTIVSDLLHVGLSVNSSKKKSPRGNDVAVQIATSLFNNFQNLKDYSVETEEEGVSTLMIIAHAPKHRERE